MAERAASEVYAVTSRNCKFSASNILRRFADHASGADAALLGGERSRIAAKSCQLATASAAVLSGGGAVRSAGSAA